MLRHLIPLLGLVWMGSTDDANPHLQRFIPIPSGAPSICPFGSCMEPSNHASQVNPEECGVAMPLTRIIGGTEVGGYRYPWFALLIDKGTKNFNVCGGSLITTWHVMTAAHCYVNEPDEENPDNRPYKEKTRVALGTYNRCDFNEPTRQIFNTDEVIVHEDYDYEFNDIAILKLDREATGFTLACLPPQGDNNKREPAIVIGYGAVDQQNTYYSPCKMMEVNITKYTRRECSRTGLHYDESYHPSTLCAGRIRGGKDNCEGDSGGPLMTWGSGDGRFTVVGVVSYGYGCGNRGYPGVYCNVANFRNWIENKIKSSDEGAGGSGGTQGGGGEEGQRPQRHRRYPEGIQTGSSPNDELGPRYRHRQHLVSSRFDKLSI